MRAILVDVVVLCYKCDTTMQSKNWFSLSAQLNGGSESSRHARVVRLPTRSAVLRRIQRHERPISRREVAASTGLDASTITHVVADLIGAGLVRECGATPINGESRRGRREIGLELVPTGAFAIGVHLGIGSLRVVASDLRGSIVARRGTLHRPDLDPELTLRVVADLVGDILNREPLDPDRVVGVGVGAVAFLDPIAGVIDSAPSLGWGPVPIVAPLSARLGRPVSLDHHVRAMALAEQWFGRARATPNFAVVSVDATIGVGVVVDGKLVRGNYARAGQLAHMVVAADGPACACGRRGCLVTLASYRALARRAAEFVRENPDSALAHAVADGPGVPLENVVFDLAGRGDASATELVDEIAGYVAVAVAHLASLLDPQLIVLAAGTPGHAEVLLDPIRRRVLTHAPFDAGSPPPIVTTALGWDLPVLGAAALAFEHFAAAPAGLRS
jgi:predicted NBD/HSP70 family sugar kinase